MHATDEDGGSDDDFGCPKKSKKKGKGKASSVSLAEQARGDAHTLQEHNDFLVSSSFNASFGTDGFGAMGASSSQAGGRLDDDFLDGLDIAGDIGDALAKELGEEWGMFTQPPPSEYVVLCNMYAIPILIVPPSDQINLNALELDLGGPADMNVDFELGGDFGGLNSVHDVAPAEANSPGLKRVRRIMFLFPT